jgi:hypothetical protein
MSVCPFRDRANQILTRLDRSGLGDTMMYRNVANEFDRDMLTAESRLHLILPKVEEAFEMLVAAKRSRVRRQMALAVIRNLKARVR